MAYTSGIFYIDPVSGSDTARTALTSCTASNPSGSITRINKTGHGLVTGAVVDLTLFTAWLNDAWKITVVDANNFDLDGAVWQTTADASGTATPRGGASWSDAWKTTTSGATAARTQPGDTIRIAKNSETSASVNATFTSGSKTVTLASALTKTIEHAVSGWTASTNITGSTNANRKYGATATVMTPGAAFGTGKVCYKAIDGGGTQNFSGYTKISFWFRSTSGTVITASTYKICLCSDATGDTIVNEINIPATVGNANWQIVALDYGGALSSSVQSVAIYANSDPGTTAFSFNNIVACNGVTHETLIGWTGDCFYNVQAFDSTTVTIDSNNTSVGGAGWYGTNGTATLYYVSPFAHLSTNGMHTINEGGTRILGAITYSGGWDTGTNTQNGRTYFASNSVNTAACFTVGRDWVNFKSFVVARFGTGYSGTNGVSNIVEDCIFSSCGNAILYGASSKQTFTSCKFLNASSEGASANPGGVFISCVFANNTNRGVSLLGPSTFISCTFGNNQASVIFSNIDLFGSPYFNATLFRNCLFADIAETVTAANTFGTLWSFNHDQTAGNHWGFEYGATINRQSSVVHGSEPVAWRVVHSSSDRNASNVVSMKIGEFAVSASSLVTFKAWVKKDHATDVSCRIKVLDALYSLPGITETTATKANDTNWEELTITFTPTSAGIVPIYFESWRTGAQSNTYIGSVTCTQ